METTKILETVQELGFTVTEVEGQGHVFTYRDLNMYFLSDDRDDGHIRLTLPMLWQKLKPSQMPVVLDMLNMLNTRNETTKLYLRDDQVWCWFETRVSEEGIIGKTIELGLLSLIGTYEEFLQMLNGEFDPKCEDLDYLGDDVYGCVVENEEFESFLMGDFDHNFAQPMTKANIEEEKYPF